MVSVGNTYKDLHILNCTEFIYGGFGVGVDVWDREIIWCISIF